jgi:hypothetical protein
VPVSSRDCAIYRVALHLVVSEYVQCMGNFNDLSALGARDFGMNLFPTSLAIVQALLPGCGGTCVPCWTIFKTLAMFLA